MNPTIFRQYDIRGHVGEDLTDETVELIARGIGTYLARSGVTSVALGRDVRLSSPGFARAATRGFVATGLHVVDVGIVPTPVLYYAIEKLGAGGGLMITGSHNPVEYNGLKICKGSLAIYGEEIQTIRRLVEAGDFESGNGSAEEKDILATYEAELGGAFHFARRFKVVVDCGNGVMGPVVPRILRAFGHEVNELYCEPDGRFPNHLPDPEVPAYMADLMRTVTSTGADLGLGFDGDGDRVGLIDETGRKISADWLVAVFARDLLDRYPGGKVRYDVKCSDFLDGFIRRHGGEPVMGRTGHSILKQDMKEMDAILGGELSGHIVFGRDWHLIDDSLYSALEVMALMEKSDCKCSGLFQEIPETFSTAEIKVPVPESEKFGVVDRLTADFKKRGFDVVTIDGARVKTPDGWGLVRASNTTANLTVRLEAATPDGLETLKDLFLEVLGAYEFLDLSRLQEAS